MSRWFRMYDEVLDDPKVQRLSGEDFKAWVNILCLASRNEGNLPPVDDIAFALRLDSRKTTAILGRITAAGLIDNADGTLSPHGWNARQYKSDVSTDRVKRFRERKKGVPGNGDETFHATAPDTETETDVSVAKATATIVPLIDPEKVMFDQGIRYLASCGVSEAKARPQLGKWKRDHGAGAVIEAIGAAQRQGVVDPMAWIEGRWRADRATAAARPAVPL